MKLTQIAKEVRKEAMSGVAQRFSDSKAKKAKKAKPAVMDKAKGKNATKQFGAKLDRAKPNLKVKPKKVAETKK